MIEQTQARFLQSERVSLRAWLGVVLLFIFFGLLVAVLIGASPRGNDYEAKRAHDREQKLKSAREEADKDLHSYAWVDKSKGVARIPIERAMELALPELAQKKPTAANPIESPSPASGESPSAATSSSASGTAQPSPAAAASSAPAQGMPKPALPSVQGPKNPEIRGQPAGAANPPNAAPGSQPGPSTSPPPPSPPIAPQNAAPTATPNQNPPGTPLPVAGKSPPPNP